jgi:hypothetical protein
VFSDLRILLDILSDTTVAWVFAEVVCSVEDRTDGSYQCSRSITTSYGNITASLPAAYAGSFNMTFWAGLLAGRDKPSYRHLFATRSFYSPVP